MSECSEGQTDAQTAVANIHFTSAAPHAKCNNSYGCVQATADADWPDVDLSVTGQTILSVLSTTDQRPHTISSAYERSAHARPSLSADTFTPLPAATSVGPTSRSRPPSVHGGPLPSAGTPPSSASPYAVPCIVPKHRRDASASGAKVADIYARPALVGARAGSVRALPVATPTVPDFVGPLSPQAAVSAPSEGDIRLLLCRRKAHTTSDSPIPPDRALFLASSSFGMCVMCQMQSVMQNLNSVGSRVLRHQLAKKSFV